MSECEYGKCEVCGKEAILGRKYYYYPFGCECHSNLHFELVRHCKDCEPSPPARTTVSIVPLEDEGDEIKDFPFEANLGCATTRELLGEITARIEMHSAGGLDYRTVDY